MPLKEKPHCLSPVVALTIAGSDNSAGAGIQADLKTFTRFGVYGQTVVTCVVAEAPGKVLSIQAIDAAVIRDQLTLSLEYFPVTAIKTGMLFSAEIIDEVCSVLESRSNERRPLLVVDPVMAASSGDPLLEPGAISRYTDRLFPMATVITPNLDEAGILLGEKITSIEEMRKAAEKLYARFGVPFLIKGGHLHLKEAIDFLIDGKGIHSFTASFLDGVSTHGTGCTYSAAIAANLALGQDLLMATETSKHHITTAITNSYRWPRGSGWTSALGSGLVDQSET